MTILQQLSWQASAEKGIMTLVGGRGAVVPVFSVNKVGLVPAPTAQGTSKFLREDGTWQIMNKVDLSPASTFIINAAAGSWGGLRLSQNNIGKWLLLTDNAGTNLFSIFAVQTLRDVLKINQQGNWTIPAPASGHPLNVFWGTNDGVILSGTPTNVSTRVALGSEGESVFGVYYDRTTGIGGLWHGTSATGAKSDRCVITPQGNWTLTEPSSGGHSVNLAAASVFTVNAKAGSWGGIQLARGGTNKWMFLTDNYGADMLSIYANVTGRDVLAISQQGAWQILAPTSGNHSISGPLKFGTTGAQWEVDLQNRLFNSGNTQPYVNATRSSSQTSGTTLIYDVEHNDQGGHYNNTTGVFTAPVAGKYLVTCSALFTNTTGSSVIAGLEIFDGGGATYGRSNIEIPNGQSRMTSLSAIVPLSAGSTVATRSVDTLTSSFTFGASVSRLNISLLN